MRPDCEHTRKLEALHRRACDAREETYQDPATREEVFTEYYLAKRGYCCNQGCRHCPYGDFHITIRYKDPS